MSRREAVVSFLALRAAGAEEDTVVFRSDAWVVSILATKGEL